MSEKTIARSTTRRETVKAPFVAPTIITWSLTPPLAGVGSRDHAPRERDRAQHEEIPRPPRSEN
jgi:hypothetical protein